MTKKGQKEYKEFVKLQMQVLNFNARVEMHNSEKKALDTEREKLKEKLDKLIAKYEKEDRDDTE